MLKVLAVVVVAWGCVQGSPMLTGDPYKDILDDPNFRPQPEKTPNKTIDQVITEMHGSLNTYMSDNFLDMRGDITTELDMVLKPMQYKSMYLTDHGRHKRKATRPLVYRWTDNTIPYEFITSHFNVNEIYYIKAAMRRWQETTCLKFRPATSRDSNRIRFQNGNGCNSLLGMAGGMQPINLQSPGCRYSGLYLHEVGHAIGLVHEHQLPDRDQYIYIIYDNVAPSMRIWFNKYSTKDVNQYGVPFEYSSVMHYGITAFSKDGSSQTIRAKDRRKEKEIGRVYLKGLSFSDIKVVNLMYGCNAHCAKNPNCKDPGYLDKNCNCVRPDDDGSTTTTTKPGSCSNVWKDEDCDGWAQAGECNANRVWMEENCKKSCNACDNTGDGGKPDSKECTNVWGDQKCQGWADSGECEANPIWMKQNCKKSCKDCEDNNGGGGGGVRCIDNNQYCASWAKSGYCATNWYTKENCHKSCSTCSKASNDDSKTESEEERNSGMTVRMSLLMIVLAAFTGNYLSIFLS
ncbi:zinc metalloproteinase nas-15-like [Babylonia areolata]|uniref:zinc metalloproteinase nas-15-like n=1 Tax=Babylonia areolata TaxID=304850 RepID=UPI003FD27D67